MSPSPPLYLKLGWRSWRACVLLQKKAKQRVPTLPFIFFPLLPLFPQLHHSSWSRRQTQSRFTPLLFGVVLRGLPQGPEGPGASGAGLGTAGGAFPPRVGTALDAGGCPHLSWQGDSTRQGTLSPRCAFLLHSHVCPALTSPSLFLAR